MSETSAPETVPALQAPPIGRRIRTALPALAAGSVALATLGGLRYGSVSVSALGSMVLAVVFLFSVLRRGTRVSSAVAAVTVPTVFIIALISASSIGTDVSIGGLQQVVVWLASSLAVVYAFNVQRGNEAALNRQLITSMRFATVLLAASTAATLGPLEGSIISPRVAALGALVPLTVFVANWYSDRVSKLYAIFTTVFILATISRTASAVALLVLVLGRPSTGRRMSGKTVARLGILFLAFYLAVTQWAPLRDRFTTGDVSLQFGSVSINGMGRARVWSQLWAQSFGEPLTGHGLGSAREATQLISPGIEHPHQEYLRLFFEGGALTVALFVIGLASTWVILTRLARAAEAPSARSQVHGARLMVVVVVLTSLTDNTLVYPFVIIPYGLFVGLAMRTQRASGQA